MPGTRQDPDSRDDRRRRGGGAGRCSDPRHARHRCRHRLARGRRDDRRPRRRRLRSDEITAALSERTGHRTAWRRSGRAVRPRTRRRRPWAWGRPGRHGHPAVDGGGLPRRRRRGRWWHCASSVPAADGGWWLLGLPATARRHRTDRRRHVVVHDTGAQTERLSGHGRLTLRTVRDMDTWADAVDIAEDIPRSRARGAERSGDGRMSLHVRRRLGVRRGLRRQDRRTSSTTSGVHSRSRSPSGRRPPTGSTGSCSSSPCDDATIDIGCGPGRLVAELAARRIPAMGIDVSSEAIRQTRVRGALALRRDVFGDHPRRGPMGVRASGRRQSWHRRRSRTPAQSPEPCAHRWRHGDRRGRLRRHGARCVNTASCESTDGCPRTSNGPWSASTRSVMWRRRAGLASRRHRQRRRSAHRTWMARA